MGSYCLEEVDNSCAELEWYQSPLLRVSGVQVCMIIMQSNGYKASSGVPSLVW